MVISNGECNRWIVVHGVQLGVVYTNALRFLVGWLCMCETGYKSEMV